MYWKIYYSEYFFFLLWEIVMKEAKKNIILG